MKFQRPPFRRGLTSMLAMLYMILFSTLAVGFYAMINTSMAVASNERHNSRALLAAESGMQFIRYQLADLELEHDTPPAELFEAVYYSLAEKMEETGNLGENTIGYDGGTITIPAESGQFISLDNNGSQFRAIITQQGQQIRVKVVGRYEATESARGIQLDYAIAQRASAIFNYGVASRSAITMQGNTSIVGASNSTHGSVLSTTYSTNTPLTMTGSCEISGDVSIVNPDASISVSSTSSIAGSRNPGVWNDHVHFGVPEPEFPTIDSSIFLPYVTNTYSGGNQLTNTRIPANTNPSFSGGAVLRGVIYIESPNNIRFNGNCTIQGVIVVENDPSGNVNTNVLDFRGGVDASSVSTLPQSFGGLRELTGAMVLAPNFTLKFGGNFGTIAGSIIGSKIEFSGNAGGVVKGSVINLDDTSLTLAGNSDILIESQGTSAYPAGVYFGSNYVPLPDTYREVQP